MQIGQLAIREQAEYLRLLAGSGFRCHQVGDGWAVATGLESNTENGIVVSAATVAQAGAVEELVTWLRDQELPASLIVTEPVPADQVSVLVGAGLVPENAGYEMGRPLTSADACAEPPAEPPVGPSPKLTRVAVTEVTDERALLDALTVPYQDGWFDSPAELDRWLAASSRIGYGPAARIRRWVAYADGRAVGSATSFRFDQTVALTHCCVAKPFRRRGIAVALTRHRLSAAWSDGAQNAILSPSPDGYQLHRTLGFEHVHALTDRWFYLRT